ncbi:MAG: S41 family peptidase [Anaerolineae bacterium]|nr:S41 family peptidase [Anaerolineae bacterium]
MNNYVRYLLVAVLLFFACVAGLAGGVVADRVWQDAFASDTSETADLSGTAPDMELITEAWELIDEHYVDREAVEAERLTYGAISGMVMSLGDTGHSVFLSPEMLRSYQIDLEGEFEGIGAYVEMQGGYVIIVTPMDGSPAQEAGLRPGDVVLQVDGEDMTGMTLDEVISYIMGPAGTDVALTIFRPETQETLEVTITRARIIVQSVTWKFMPGTQVAHVRIAQFSLGMTDELKQALKDLKEQGAEGIVLDLRNNPGGALDEAVDTTSQFLSDGNVLLERDAEGNERPTRVKPGGLATDIPMVVLINEGSASASEIVSGAIQDADRAQLVGETTFGTGTVLNQFKLSDGSAMLLAVEEWLTPNGRLIWHQGIEPDVEVKLPVNASMLLPEAETDMTPEQLRDSEDIQLLAALDLLLEIIDGGGG